MAGKSNLAENSGGASISEPLDSSLPSKNGSDVADGVVGATNGPEDGSVLDVDANGSAESAAALSKQGEGEMHLFSVPVKSQTGEKLELQLSPGDSVMDVRQFLLDAPETCFFTCYDLILHTKDGAAHTLEDYNDLSEVSDITTGGCSIEMVSALYDERSIRSHIRRARDLLSLSAHHTSPSTLLTLQHQSNSVKVDVPELENLGFMDDIASSIGSLMSASRKDIICVNSIIFSSFNPPPSYRRLVGDLIYIDVVTLEGSKYCITGSVKSFYVNSSNGSLLDPKPHKQHAEATTLIGLLQKISPKFKKGFLELLDWKSSAHPFENVPSLLPPNAWLGQHPVTAHKRDAARAEDAYSLSYGTELIGMQRDWNEELQSCREFPHGTLQERILRDRALYKVSCDFVDAAIKGAVGVINRCIPPINPTDPECFHMYVHNNIFFSFAVDELGQISDVHGSAEISKLHCHLQEEASRNATFGSDAIKACDIKSSNGVVLTQGDDRFDVNAEAQSADGEQATYASANNDLKGTKAYQDADVPGLYNLAMAIVDYRGYRVVAQSIIPGILQGDKSDSLLYGSVDNGKKISCNEVFHSKVLEAAKRLHIKEHKVLDGSGNVVKLAAPVECKGIVGSDGRHYLLDLMRITPRDVNFAGPGSKFCVLRPELVSSFCRVVSEQRLNSSSKVSDQVLDKPGSSVVVPVEPPALEEDDKVAAAQATYAQICSSSDGGSSEEILLNPNVFTEFKISSTNEEIAADEAIVKRACSYLCDAVVPNFVQDLCSLEVSPMDGSTLTDALHTHGINVRYLGKIANMTKHLPHLWDMCTIEVVVRSAKHILKDILREVQDYGLAPAISHFLNCLFGSITSVDSKFLGSSSLIKSKRKEILPHQSSRKSRKQTPAEEVGLPPYLCLTSDIVWSQIQEFSKYKYQFELPDDAKTMVKKVLALRNLCLKVGICIAGRKYDFSAAMPFQASDILNLLPIVKHSVPVSSEAKSLIESGKARLAEGLLNEAYKLFSDAFSLLQQITGPMHREVASCCRYLAMVLYHAGDMAGAITQQHKELIINERCLGLDHPDTAHSYGNMSLFYHGLNQTELALRHMSRALLLLSLSSGADHPDVAATFINIAMMYQDTGKMSTALRYLQEALKMNERLLGQEHIQTAVCYHALAIACNCMGAYKLSLQHEKKAHDIFVKQLGEDDSRTRDSESWIKTFQMRFEQANAQKQSTNTVNAASAQKAIDILKANPDLVQAFQASAGSGSSSSSLGFGDGFPRGRGVDERAARAVAEARKKAAAKGLILRPHGVSAQTMPQLAQLLNIINSGANPDCSIANETKHESTAASTTSENGVNPSILVGDLSLKVDKDQAAPVGLGTGLSSLPSKKQKQKQGSRT